MADEMFVQQLVQVNAKVLHNWPVVKGIYGWPADFFTTGQLIPRHDVIMEMCYTGLCEFIGKYIHWNTFTENKRSKIANFALLCESYRPTVVV